MLYLLLIEEKKKRKKREKGPGGFLFPGQTCPICRATLGFSWLLDAIKSYFRRDSKMAARGRKQKVSLL
jgi:hypothetical protein